MGSLRVVSLLGLVAGCGFHAGGQPVDAGVLDGADGDARVDAPVDAAIDTTVMADASLCFEGFTRVCLAVLPSAPRVITADATMDTTSGCAVTTMGTASGVCVIAATTIEIKPGATLHTTGTKPLVLLATTAILVTGTLDAASHRPPGTTGPGAGLATCAAGTAPTLANGSGGGGYGGTFATIGGDGGDSSGRGAKGVAPTTAIVPTTLRAGCPGVPGASSNPGLGGAAGGAIELLAPSITVAGLVNASGAAGLGGIMNDSGGGGGGSGGMIVFDTAALTVTGVVLAQGGGGGGGSGNTGAGTPGSDPITAGTAAGGGVGLGGTSGGGGTGAIAADAGDAQTGNQIGGGGGGGGAGFTKGPTTAGTISPPFH